MTSYPSPGQLNNRAMNGGPNPYRMGNARYANNPAASDLDSHYTNPYSETPMVDYDTSTPKNYNNKLAVHRPRLNRKNAQEDKSKSNLTTNFDPMKDRHMWAMWRTAVNGRIVDQVRKNEQFKQDALLPPDEFSSVTGDNPATYGKDLASAPPLSRFIRLNQKSKNIAQGLMNEGQGKLETTQFIYYGLPRVAVNTNNNRKFHGVVNGNHHNLGPMTNIAGNGNFDNMNFYSGDGGGPRMQPL